MLVTRWSITFYAPRSIGLANSFAEEAAHTAKALVFFTSQGSSRAHSGRV